MSNGLVQRKFSTSQLIGSTWLGYNICFVIWTVYWKICLRFHNGKHFDGAVYDFIGQLRSSFLNIGADEHPGWKERGRLLCSRRWKRRSLFSAYPKHP